MHSKAFETGDFISFVFLLDVWEWRLLFLGGSLRGPLLRTWAFRPGRRMIDSLEWFLRLAVVN
jgi:hypothetical protein